MAGRTGAARDQQSARRVLVEPVDELGPRTLLVGEPVEQPVEMLVGLGPALGREAGRLVEHERMGIVVDHHVAHELRFVVGQLLALADRPRGPRRSRLGRRDADLLPGLDPVARRGFLAVEPKLPGPRPA